MEGFSTVVPEGTTPSARRDQSARISIRAVAQHLADMHEIYNSTRGLGIFELYKYLTVMEENYSNDGDVRNFCSMVHLMHPLKCQEDSIESVLRWSTSSMLKCFECDTQLTDELAYNVHILNTTVICPKCTDEITYEKIAVRSTIWRYNTKREIVTRYAGIRRYSYPEQIDDISNTWVDFCANLKAQLGSRFDTDHRHILMEIVHSFRDNLSCFSFDLIKGMYRQLDFIVKVCVNFSYWAQDSTLSVAVQRYNKFLQLMFHCDGMLVPTVDIDLVWHAHLVTAGPIEYFEDTNRICGREIDHDDTIRHADLQKAYTDTFLLWSNHFTDSSYSPTGTSLWDWQRNRCLKSIAFFPYGMYRVYLWYRRGRRQQQVAPVDSSGAAVVTAEQQTEQQQRQLAELQQQRQQSNKNINKNNKKDKNKNTHQQHSLAIIGTPVMDATVRPEDSSDYAVLYEALAAIHETATMNRIVEYGSTGDAATDSAAGGDGTDWRDLGGCGGGCGASAAAAAPGVVTRGSIGLVTVTTTSAVPVIAPPPTEREAED